MEKLVARRRDKVFFGEKLERIGDQGIDQSQTGEPENRRAVGADAVLNERASLALDPAENAGQIEDHEEDEKRFGRDNRQINDHDAPPPPLPLRCPDRRSSRNPTLGRRVFPRQRFENLGGTCVTVAFAAEIQKLNENLAVLERAFGRDQRGVEFLHAPLPIGVGALFFAEMSRGQNHMRQLRGLTEPRVLNNQKR